MKRLQSLPVIALVLGTFVSTNTAFAWDRREVPPPTPSRSEQFGVNLGAGMMGLAAGIIVGQAVSPSRSVEIRSFNQPPRYHRDHWDRWDRGDRWNHDRPYRQFSDYNTNTRFQPWSPAWYRWCENHYSNFDPDTGTYIDFNGVNRFCEVRR